ncbi:MAG: glutathione-disulfide reductase [Proteobacteria bacterium]|nr:glutathione-disulfide reductase [Pseudomonadota bacterium]
MAQFDYDLFVIGGGSGGVRAARAAGQSGARVAIAEEHRYGGTCVIRGCVPKKILVYASEYGHELSDAAAYGWNTGPVSFDWARLIANKDKEIDRLNGIYIGLLERSGVEVMNGRAVLSDPHTLDIDGNRVTARIILIATGARPLELGVPGQELAISSNEAFHLPELPERITVVGGGYIGVEFAHIFSGLGASVTLVHHRDRVLRGFDEDIRIAIMDGLDHHGIELRMNEEVGALARRADGAIDVTLKSGAEFSTDLVMSSIGRVPNTSEMGLEGAGVTLGGRGAVVVDRYSRTSVDHIYAVGDCTDRVNLTPVAIREGQAFVDTVFHDRPTAFDHSGIATAVFAQPPAGTVGLTEAEAREQFGEVDIYKSTFRPLRHTISGRGERAMMKLVVDARSDRVLGVHVVGIDAAEIIQSVAIAVTMGATKAQFDAVVAVHPTTAEELVLMKQKAS